MDWTFYKFSDFEGILHILNGTLKFDRPTGFNDPFDCLPKYESVEFNDPRIKIAYAKQGRKPTMAGQMGFANELSSIRYHEKKNSKARILSLSKSRDNILMWSHYAKQHTGACVELDLSSEALNGKEMTDENFWHPLPVEYEIIRPSVNPFDKGKVKEEILTKHKDWKYEEEWRILRIAPDIDHKTIYNFPIDKFVKRVILGCRMPSAHQNAIISLVKDISESLQTEITVEHASISKSNYELDFKEIDLKFR